MDDSDSADSSSSCTAANPSRSEYIEDAAEEEENALNLNLLDDSRYDRSEDVENSNSGNQGAKLNHQLEEFRQQWQDELQNRPGSGRSSPYSSEDTKREDKPKGTLKEIDIEEKARNLFFQGMQAEDDGAFSEAIYYYKKALQMVPDIESKLGNIFNRSPREKVRQESVSSVDESEEEEDLLLHIENLLLDEKSLCQPMVEQRVTHISALPVELVIYILQWVISTDLDLKSLEMFSEVCRGFFSCARDERLWKMACMRVWGINLGSAKKYGGSWRRMMIERPHLLFSGCYISRMTYIRQGEQSLDNFYRPFHLVEYYRYARFFPDGIVLMLVSPEDPLQSLPKLRYRNARSPGILRGGYKMSDNKVTCVMKRVKWEQNQNYRFKRQRRAAIQNETDTTYYAELDVSSSKKRQNAQLTWVKYSINHVYKPSGEENTSNFDLDKRSFPPLIFSPVRSYTGTTTEPLTSAT